MTSSFFFLAWEETRTQVFLGPYRDAERSHHLILPLAVRAVIFFTLMQHEGCLPSIMSVHVITEHQHDLLGLRYTLDGKRESCQLDRVVSFADLTEVFSILCLAGALKTKQIDSGNKHISSHLPFISLSAPPELDHLVLIHQGLQMTTIH